VINTEIEQFFFGQIDNNAPAAVEYFARLKHPAVDEPAFKRLLIS
jgi:hypothetical protein